MKFKDLAHLYVGCKGYAQTESFGIETVIGLQGTELITNIDNIEIDDFKPILFPLSAMTDEQAITIANILYKTIYNQETVFSNIGLLTEDNAIGFIGYDEENYRTSFTINYEGLEYYINGERMICQPFIIFHYLLSHHFDLYNLIEQGEAIDVTTITPNPYDK